LFALCHHRIVDHHSVIVAQLLFGLRQLQKTEGYPENSALAEPKRRKGIIVNARRSPANVPAIRSQNREKFATTSEIDSVPALC
jgi:hypothetical protein